MPPPLPSPRRTGPVVLGLLLAACGSGSSPTFDAEIWVANAASDDIRIYDGDTFDLLDTIPTPGAVPHQLELTPDESQVWAVGIEGHVVVAIDAASREILAEIPVIEAPTTLRFSPDGRYAYVTGGEGFLDVIDTATFEVTDTEIAGFGPHGLWVLPDGSLRTANRSSNDVSVIEVDGPDATFVDHFSSGAFSYDVIGDASGETLYVTARGWDAVSVLRAEDHTIAGAIPVGHEPVIMGLALDGRRLWVANSGDSTVTAIDVPTFEVVGRDGARIGDVLSVGDRVGDCDGCIAARTDRWEDRPIAGEVVRLSSDGVVLDDGAGEFTVPEAVFLSFLGGLAPHGVTVSPDGRYVFVAYNTSDDVFVFDAESGAQVLWLHGCETEPGPTDPGCNPGANDVAVVPR